MRTWLAKLKIRAALDSDMARREVSMDSLDRRLKMTQPAEPVPATLHTSIMREVCAAASAQRRNAVSGLWRWLPVPALGVLAIVVFWWALNPPHHEPQSLTVATAALTQSQAITQTAPGAVLAPLSQEMEYLNRDFQSALEFLAASVP
jgi:hypothetical protein